MPSRRVCLFLSLICVLCAGNLSARTEVINPVAGVWANKQTLVLFQEPDSEIFYSINGADPTVSGFAYDGPVVIDVTGSVDIRIATVYADGTKDEQYVSYTVSEQLPEDGSRACEFIDGLASAPIISYQPGSSISIPDSLWYGVGFGSQVLLPGRDISFSRDSSLSRYVPLVLSDSVRSWRFVIHSTVRSGQLAAPSIPFRVEDWKKIVFTSPQYIYQIDDGTWFSGRNPVFIERNTAHTVRWQSVAYERGNAVKSFRLPAMPSLYSERQTNGAVHFGIRGDESYRFGRCRLAEGVTAGTGLYRDLLFDVFPGDAFSGSGKVALYADGVYQGELPVSFALDKRPPQMPVVQASVPGSFARSAVKLTVTAEKGCRIFYAGNVPVSIPGGFDIDTAPLYASDVTGRYTELTGNSLELRSDLETASFFKISVYAEDEYGNKSLPSVYSTIIDTCNYYFDASADAATADGTWMHPYTTMDGFSPVSSRFVRLFVRGRVEMPAGAVVPAYSCEINGSDSAELEFGSGSSYVVRSSSLAIRNCVLSKTSANTRMFVAENAVISLSNCVLSADFMDNGAVFEGNKSVITVADSSIVSQAQHYAAVFALTGCRLRVSRSRLSAVGATAVAFSVQGGHAELRGNDCNIVAELGRIGEFSQCNLIMTDNSFAAELKEASAPVWKDNVIVLEEHANVARGFD